MKTRPLFRLNLAAIIALVATGMPLAGLVTAQDHSGSEPPDPKMREMMKKAEAAGKPGPNHQKLDPLVGEWIAEVKTWVSPGAPPASSKGTAKSSWVLNGRFVRQEFSGEFMGTPFRGLSYLGYDNVREKYNSVWIDDMSTTMFTGEGEADPGGKTLTFNGDYACAMTGEKHKQAKQVYRIVSPDKHVFEMHDPQKPGDSKVMEIVYTRTAASKKP